MASTLLLIALAVPGPARAAGTAGGSVEAQLGDHDTFTRLVFPNVPDGAEATTADCRLRVAVAKPAAWPLETLNATHSARLSRFQAEEGGRALSAALPCGARITALREKAMLIVDVAGAPVPGRKPRVPGGGAAARIDAPVATAPPGPAPVPIPPVPAPRPSVIETIAGALAPVGAAQAQPMAIRLPEPAPAAAQTPVSITPVSLEDAVRQSVQDTLKRLEGAPGITTRLRESPGGAAPAAALPTAALPAAAPPAAAAPAVPPPPPPPPPIAAMDLAAWAGDEFTQTRDRLQSALAGTQGRPRVDAFIALARFALARALEEEGRAALEAAGSQSPAPDQRFTLQVLGDAFRALDGADRPDDSLFVSIPAGAAPDHHVWRTATLAPTRWPAARDGLPIALKRLLDYPAELRGRLLTILAEGAAAAGDANGLNLVVLGMITVDGTGGTDGRLDYFRGRLAELKSTPDTALDHFDKAAALRRGPFAHRAEVRAIELRRTAGTLDEEGAVAALEALRFAWRGDEVETDALAALGAAYARAAKTEAALDIFGLLGRRFGATARGRDALAAGRTLLTAVLDQLERARPGGLYALALQTRHGRLVGLADDGEASLRRRLAALLVRDGYGLEATRILHALAEDASGPRRAELGATLAGTLIDSGREGEALEVLNRTGAPDLDAGLAERRALLRAEAMLGDGDTMRVLDALRGLSGPAAARLKARALFEAGEWPSARTAFAELVAINDAPPAEDVALYGLSAYLAGDGDTVRGLAERQRGRLKGTRWEGLLDTLAPPTAAGPLSGAEVARQLATADALGKLARGWREP